MFCFQILLSHHNNHFTALYGLAAASDVDGERGGRGGGGGLIRLDIDQSRTLQCSTLMDPPRLALSVCHRVRTHSVAAHTPMHSISLYLGLTLVKSHFCDYLSVVTAHSLKICRSSGSQFDSESKRNVRKKYKVLTLETKIAFGRYGYQRGGGGKLMRLGGDQSRTVQRSTLVDLPPLLPALPYRPLQIARTVSDLPQS